MSLADDMSGGINKVKCLLINRVLRLADYVRERHMSNFLSWTSGFDRRLLNNQRLVRRRCASAMR
jgi:hypothetical protein